MRGKKAKYLRRMAVELCHLKKVPPGLDAGKYHQVNNCHAWVPSGEKDPEGNPLLKHVFNPGTIVHKNPFMSFYRKLKQLFKGGHHDLRIQNG